MSSDYLRRGRHGRGNTRGAGLEVADEGVRASKGCRNYGNKELRFTDRRRHFVWYYGI